MIRYNITSKTNITNYGRFGAKSSICIGDVFRSIIEVAGDEDEDEEIEALFDSDDNIISYKVSKVI